MNTKHEAISLTDNNINSENIVQTRLSRRQLIKMGAISTSALLLAGCGDTPQSQQISGPNSGADESGPTEVPVEKLSIDVYSLPQSELLYADREDRNPERFHAVFENGTREERIAQFETKKVDVLTDGNFDLEKACDAFAYKLEAALNLFCSPEYVKDYIGTKDDGTFAKDMSIHDADIVRGLGGYELDRYNDEEILELSLYKEFTAAHQAMLTRYIRNAQAIGGNLNETVKFISRNYISRKETTRYRIVEFTLGFTNEVDKSNPPIDSLADSGTMDMYVYHDEDDTKLVCFSRPDEHGGTFIPDGPLEKLANAA